MKKYRPIFLVISTVAILTLVGYLLVRGAHFDVLQPTGGIGKQQRDLLYVALLLSAVVVLPVFALLGSFAWKYRAGAQSHYAPEWSSNSKLEAIWWGIPIAIIAVLAVIAWQTSHSLDPYRKIESSAKTVEVQVVALQWKWLFIYPDLGVATVNYLAMPVNVPVHFSLAADAPMSAFWIPSLGSQIYAMNGMSSQLNLIAESTGTYPGYSTNINGKGYSDMKFEAKVQTTDEFDAWASKSVRSDDMMDWISYEKLASPGTMGEKTYMLMDNSLYWKILEKQGGHSMGSGSGSSDHHHEEGM